MTEDFRLSTIRMRIDQEIQIDARGGVEEIEDASVATEITAFDRESETYYLEGAVLFSGFIRGGSTISPEQWLRSPGDVFDAEKTAGNHGEVSPLYYRLPFSLRVPIDAQEGPFFNVTARVGTWNLTVSEPNRARVKADLLIQGLSGTGGYEFEVGSQREARDASGSLVSALKPETVDSPFVTYENREWLLEGHQTAEEEEVIFIRDMVTQSRSAESEEEAETPAAEQMEAVEETNSAAELDPVYAETRSESIDAGYETESVEQRESIDNLFPQSLSEVQYPFVTSVNLFPSQSAHESGISTDGQLFQWQGGDLFQSNASAQIPSPSALPQEAIAAGSPFAGWGETVGKQAEALTEEAAGQTAHAADSAESASVAETSRSESADGLEVSEQLAERKQVSDVEDQAYEREETAFQAVETYQFAFPEVSLESKGTVGLNPTEAEEKTMQQPNRPVQPAQAVGFEEPAILKSESSLSYQIRSSEKEKEAEPLSFAGLAGGELFGKRMVSGEQLEEMNQDLEALIEESLLKLNKSGTDESIWSRFTDSDEKRYTMVFRIVQSSDTLETLAEKFSVSVKELMRENRLAQETIESGQLLYIPRR